MTLQKLNYLNNFWKIISEGTECECFYIKVEENMNDTTDFICKIHTIFDYYKEMIKAYPLNNKLLVLSSIGIY